jgi:hypothetical protein
LRILRWAFLAAAAASPLLIAGFAHAMGCAGGPDQLQIVATQSSGNVANAAAVATLPAPAPAQSWYVTAIEAQATGSTSAAVVNVTLAGLNNGAGVSATALYPFVFPAGVTTAATPLTIMWNRPLAGLPGTAVVLTLPAGGSGNTNASVNIHGCVQ